MKMMKKKAKTLGEMVGKATAGMPKIRLSPNTANGARLIKAAQTMTMSPAERARRNVMTTVGQNKEAKFYNTLRKTGAGKLVKPKATLKNSK